MSGSEVCSPPWLTWTQRTRPAGQAGAGRRKERTGRAYPCTARQNLPASMKPVRTETPACEISDWLVKLTGRDRKTAVDFCIERVLPRSANNGLDNH